jgi:succinate dehydrogenase / fumarate reductase cytochrome b subunit
MSRIVPANERIDAAAPSMRRARAALFTSSIALKWVMAISGLVWVGFLLGHVGTNLHIFGGAESLNDYYAALKANTLLFWGVRVALVSSIVAHVAAAWVLAQRNREARPVSYRMRRSLTSSIATRSMLVTGPLLAAFIVYHLLHLTVGTAMPETTPFVEGDDYSNIVTSFSNPYVAAIYIVSVTLLGLHLWHGAWAATMTLGARHPRHDARLRIGVHVVMALVLAGLLAIPVAVLAGVLAPI